MGMIDLSGGIPGVAALDYNMAKEMSDILHEAYPRHLWAVTCEGDKGIATVRNMALSGEWGFVLKLSEIYTASDWKKKIVRAGGELLERFCLARCEGNQDAIAGLKNDFSGQSFRVIPNSLT